MLTSDHATLEEMRQIVCFKKLRPTLAEQWNQDEVSGREVLSMCKEL